MTRAAYDVALGSRSVTIAELTVAEIVKCARGAGLGSGVDASMAMKQLGLQLALRVVDGATVGFNDLDGSRWDARFSIGETLSLMSVFDQVHDATQEALDALLTAATVTEGPDGTTTTVKLAGQAIAFRRLGFGAFRAAMAMGDKEPTPAAKDYVSGLATVRRSIATIDGAEPTWNDDLSAWPWSPKNTALLMGVSRALNGLDGAARPTVVAST